MAGPSSSATDLSTLRKFVRTAVCILPFPFEAPNAHVQAIREQHDKAYTRWPPHVNLLFPFVQGPADVLVAGVQDALRSGIASGAIKPFSLNIAEFRTFTHGGKAQAYLHPEEVDGTNVQQELFKALAAKFPQCVERPEFVPHMSVGQFPARTASATLAKFQASWTPIRVTVAHIAILIRDGEEPFRIHSTIPLTFTATPAAAPVPSRAVGAPVVAPARAAPAAGSAPAAAAAAAAPAVASYAAAVGRRVVVAKPNLTRLE